MSRVRSGLGAGLLAAATVLSSLPAATAAESTSPPEAAVIPSVDPWLQGHLAELAADELVEVIVHGVDFDTAAAAIADHGLLDTHPLYDDFAFVDAAVAIGTPGQILDLADVEGLTHLEGNQPYTWFTDTSHDATNQIDAEAAYAGHDALPSGLSGTGVGIAIVDSGVDWSSPMFNDVENSPTNPLDDVNKVVRRLKVNPACQFLSWADDATNSQNCVYDAPQGSDISSAGGHGTHVAGIAAGYVVDDPLGGRTLRGAAPGAEVTELATGAAISVLGSAAAMRWVHLHHADPCATRPVNYSGYANCSPIRVTNHSYGPLGGGTYNPNSTEAKINKLLIEDGITTVWAAGNDGSGSNTSVTNPPAGDPNGGVIVVANYSDGDSGSRDRALNTSSSTGQAGNQKTFPDLAAPGTRITSACNPALAICRGLIVVENPYYGTISGTSMAAPHVAGIAAVLIQAASDLHAGGVTLNPLYDPDGDGVLLPADIENLLEDTAEQKSALVEDVVAGGDWFNPTDADGGTSTTSYDWGHGLVDVLAAVDALTGADRDGGGGNEPSCDPLITDPAGDGINPVTLQPAADLDLTGGAITALEDGTTVFEVVIPDLQAGTSTGSNGDLVSFAFTAGGTQWELRAQRLAAEADEQDPTGALGSFNFYSLYDVDAAATATFDLVGEHDVDAGIVRFVLTPQEQQTFLQTDLTAPGAVTNLGLRTTAFVTALGFVVDEAVSGCTWPAPVDTDLTVTVADVAASEAAGVVTVTLTADGTADGDETVLITTADGTATANDYVAIIDEAVEFAAGATSTTVDITLIDDADVEDDETFTVSLAAGNGTVVGTPGTATVTIADDDDGASTSIVSVTPDTVEEAEGASLDVVLTLSEVAASDVVVAASTTSTGDGSEATAGEDYVTVDTTVTFVPGQTSAVVTIDVLDDDVAEATETVTLDLAVVSGPAEFASGGATATAVNHIADTADQPVPDTSVDITAVAGTDAATRTDLFVGDDYTVDGVAVVPTGGGGGGGGTGSVIADAGNSAHVAVGDAAELIGTAYGNEGDVAFAWSHAGSTDRFDDASSMTPSFDTTGLPAGTTVIELAVTDLANGNTDTDTVLLSLHDGGTRTLVDVDGRAAPDVFGFVNPPIEHPFTVAEGGTDLELTLSWDDGTADLDLTVDDPTDAEDGNEDGYTASRPERIKIAEPGAGDWIAEVTGYLTAGTDYHLLVTVLTPSADPRPIVELPPAFDFQVGEAQVLTGAVSGGTAPVALEWDLDLDGVADATGDTVTTSFGRGQHLVALKATDAAGYEYRVITAVRVGDSVGPAAGLVVVAVTDTGINPYHEDFSAALYPDEEVLALTNGFTRHPSEYLTGYPANAQALELTLGQGYFPAQDQAAVDAIEYGQLYWIPGTKIVGARDDNSSYGNGTVDNIKLIDEHSHGTRSASVAVGNIYGFCPSCLLAVGEGFGNDAYFNGQSWVDLTSNSFGAIGGVGFGGLASPSQPRSSAEGGQIALYASGNGVENAFVTPQQTYLPENLGPDWMVRVGAAVRSSRKPIIGDGSPVDISSWGSGAIPAANINTTTGTANHSGTSAATPYTAGALGDLLRRIRIQIGDGTNGWAGGVVADGATVAASAYLGDGSLTRAELLEAFFKTAFPDQGGSTTLYPLTAPYTADHYLFGGYGIAEPASSQRAFEVLMGLAEMPVRDAEDTFFREYDEPIRDFLWGNYTNDPDTGGETDITGFGPMATTELEAALDAGSLADLVGWWETWVGPLPNAAAEPGWLVEVAIVDAGTLPTADDWAPATDTSTEGDWSTWSFDATAGAPGAYEVHARVVDGQGVATAVDGPAAVLVRIPFDPSCAPDNTIVGEDLAGDAILFDSQGLPSDLSTDSVDLRAAEFELLDSGAMQVTLHVTDLDEEYDNIGERFLTVFTLGADTFELQAGRSLREDTGGFFGIFVSGESFTITRNDSDEQAITGAFDADADEVRWVVPADMFDGEHVDALAPGRPVVFVEADGARDNATGYHALDSMQPNGCAYHLGQERPAPAVATVTDVTVDESASVAELVVALDRPAYGSETVLLSTADESATAGEDYDALDGAVVTFAEGATSAVAMIALRDDIADEVDETFVVGLAAGEGTIVGTPWTATVTILDDDEPVVHNPDERTVSISDAAVVEGDGGQSMLEFTVSLDETATSPVVVTATTVLVDGPGAADADDVEVRSAEVVVAAGAQEATFVVAVNGDDLDEVDETLAVVLEPVSNAVIGDGDAVGTILDDDLPVAHVLGFAVGEDTAAALGGVHVEIRLEQPAAEAGSLRVTTSTRNGAFWATSGEDFDPIDVVVTFEAGQQSIFVPLVIHADSDVEKDEALWVTISEPTDVVLGSAQAVITIVNDDQRGNAKQ